MIVQVIVILDIDRTSHDQNDIESYKISNGDQKISIMIWVSPYEDPSKGKDILLNKRHQWIAVKVVRYAKFFKIGTLI